MIAELSAMRGGLRRSRAEAQREIAGGAKFNSSHASFIGCRAPPAGS
jgi:hypothetical protein